MKKQAVLLIHGIGEQKPMATLHSFVKTVWTRNFNLHNQHARDPSKVWHKPDFLSGSFELRRLTTPRNRKGVRTDFYEFYWAHMMSGTEVGHVLGWFSFLLFRDPFSLPGRLRSLYFLLAGILLVAGIFAVNAWLSFIPVPAWLSVFGAVILLPLMGIIVKRIVGDAARYLYPSPQNVQSRHEIRSAGVDLLRRLHERGYDRIVVVGHSLGSVIGYDILSHAWPEYNAKHTDGLGSALANLEEKSRSIEEGNEVDIDDFQDAQRAFFQEFRTAGNPWRVTDFITLGSPLAHAEVLMASSPDDLLSRKSNRELPTCPPELEEDSSKDSLRFSYAPPKRGGIEVPHHAAVFGPTCWSNLYAPTRWIFWGDFIAGPLRGIFGNGVRDIPVPISLRGGFLSHTLYWTEKGECRQNHIEELRKTLDL